MNPASATSSLWVPVGVADFNGDGKPDLLWRHATAGSFAVWFLDGVNRIGGTTFAGIGDLNWQFGGTGDFNYDGKPDIFWRNVATGEAKVWYMNGTTFIASAPEPPAFVALEWKVGAVGDLSADGKPDILWRNANTGELVYWLLDGIALTSSGPITGAGMPDFGWRIIGILDLDRDGKNDIVWQNATSHRLVYWTMDGTARTGGGYFVPDAPADPDLEAFGPR